MAVYFVFIDGIGVGEEGPNNPFYTGDYPFFQHMAGERKMLLTAPVLKEERRVFMPIDATLGIEGLPQSGTGQVSLFAGVNAAEHAGKHYGPFPHSTTKRMLAEHSLASRLVGHELRFKFMNAYPPIFFRMSSQRDRWSTSTLMCRQQSIPLNTQDEVIAGHAITAEITQEVWKDRLGIDLPTITELDAAERMLAAGSRHDVVMYEYYLTDKAGHAMEPAMADLVLTRIDRFLSALSSQMDPSDLLVISSDHGNVEDLGTKTHTTNPVPLLACGQGAHLFWGCRSITDVVPTLMRLFGGSGFDDGF